MTCEVRKVEIAMRQRGLDTVRLSERIGGSRSHLSQVIHGKKIPKDKYLKRLALAMDWGADRASGGTARGCPLFGVSL